MHSETELHQCYFCAEDLNAPNSTLIAEEITHGAASEFKHEPSDEEVTAYLRQWWMDKAQSEIDPLTAKMQEYGGMGRAIDLEEIGRGLTQSGVRTPAQMYGQPAQSHELQELGIYFYLLGKFARWTAAVAEGRPVSDDTLLDIGIYVRMVQRIRESGGWPR